MSKEKVIKFIKQGFDGKSSKERQQDALEKQFNYSYGINKSKIDKNRKKFAVDMVLKLNTDFPNEYDYSIITSENVKNKNIKNGTELLVAAKIKKTGSEDKKAVVNYYLDLMDSDKDKFFSTAAQRLSQQQTLQNLNLKLRSLELVGNNETFFVEELAAATTNFRKAKEFFKELTLSTFDRIERWEPAKIKEDIRKDDLIDHPVTKKNLLKYAKIFFDIAKNKGNADQLLATIVNDLKLPVNKDNTFDHVKNIEKLLKNPYYSVSKLMDIFLIDDIYLRDAVLLQQYSVHNLGEVDYNKAGYNDSQKIDENYRKEVLGINENLATAICAYYNQLNLDNDQMTWDEAIELIKDDGIISNINSQTFAKQLEQRLAIKRIEKWLNLDTRKDKTLHTVAVESEKEKPLKLISNEKHDKQDEQNSRLNVQDIKNLILDENNEFQDELLRCLLMRSYKNQDLADDLIKVLGEVDKNKAENLTNLGRLLLAKATLQIDPKNRIEEDDVNPLVSYSQNKEKRLEQYLVDKYTRDAKAELFKKQYQHDLVTILDEIQELRKKKIHVNDGNITDVEKGVDLFINACKGKTDEDKIATAKEKIKRITNSIHYVNNMEAALVFKRGYFFWDKSAYPDRALNLKDFKNGRNVSRKIISGDPKFVKLLKFIKFHFGPAGNAINEKHANVMLMLQEAYEHLMAGKESDVSEQIKALRKFMDIVHILFDIFQKEIHKSAEYARLNADPVWDYTIFDDIERWNEILAEFADVTNDTMDHLGFSQQIYDVKKNAIGKKANDDFANQHRYEVLLVLNKEAEERYNNEVQKAETARQAKIKTGIKVGAVITTGLVALNEGIIPLFFALAHHSALALVLAIGVGAFAVNLLLLFPAAIYALSDIFLPSNAEEADETPETKTRKKALKIFVFTLAFLGGGLFGVMGFTGGVSAIMTMFHLTAITAAVLPIPIIMGVAGLAALGYLFYMTMRKFFLEKQWNSIAAWATRNFTARPANDKQPAEHWKSYVPRIVFHVVFFLGIGAILAGFCATVFFLTGSARFLNLTHKIINGGTTVSKIVSGVFTGAGSVGVVPFYIKSIIGSMSRAKTLLANIISSQRQKYRAIKFEKEFWKNLLHDKLITKKNPNGLFTEDRLYEIIKSAHNKVFKAEKWSYQGAKKNLQIVATLPFIAGAIFNSIGVSDSATLTSSVPGALCPHNVLGNHFFLEVVAGFSMGYGSFGANYMAIEDAIVASKINNFFDFMTGKKYISLQRADSKESAPIRELHEIRFLYVLNDNKDGGGKWYIQGNIPALGKEVDMLVGNVKYKENSGYTFEYDQGNRNDNDNHNLEHLKPLFGKFLESKNMTGFYTGEAVSNNNNDEQSENQKEFVKLLAEQSNNVANLLVNAKDGKEPSKNLMKDVIVIEEKESLIKKEKPKEQVDIDYLRDDRRHQLMAETTPQRGMFSTFSAIFRTLPKANQLNNGNLEYKKEDEGNVSKKSDKFILNTGGNNNSFNGGNFFVEKGTTQSTSEIELKNFVENKKEIVNN